MDYMSQMSLDEAKLPSGKNQGIAAQRKEGSNFMLEIGSMLNDDRENESVVDTMQDEQ